VTLLQTIVAGRILLLLALATLCLCLALSATVSRKLRILGFVVLVGALIGFPNFGVLHPKGSGYRSGPIHYYDAFHYFMGAKYFPEVGYSGLYEATLVAAHDVGALRAIPAIRDLMSYTMRPAGSVDTDAVRARFSKERWRQFKDDLIFFGSRIDAWPELLLDRGYNDPPPRALLLHALVDRLSATSLTLHVLTALDYVVVAVAFAAAWRAFGALPSTLALAFFALSFFARFDWIGGSLLRWDWIAAVLLGAAAYVRGRGTVAGVCLGYAALARIFPIAFFVPLAIRWLQGRWRRTPDPALTACLRSGLGLVVLVWAVVAVSGEPLTHARDFVSKIRTHAQDPSVNSVGLGSVLVFGQAPWLTTAGGTVYVTEAATAAARPARYLLPLISTLYLLVVLPLVLRARAVESLMYAVPLIFCGLTLSGYYYSFLVLLVLLPWEPGHGIQRVSLLEIAVLAGFTAASYAFEFASPDFLPLFYQASIQLGLFFVVWVGLEYVRFGFLGQRFAERARMLDSHMTAGQPSAPA
jgi:hypothetical protein